ncbi:hypothetical protein BDZ45DRAFT_231807 [Acephala macrosclerotiorum]|nr:hypothetical protein BDZ45DRAFT_231807 [Acephala macrosclerotiorum]
MYVTRPDHLAPDRHDDRAFGPSRPARITTAPRLSLPATSQYRLGQPPTFRPVAYNHFGHFSPQLGNAQYPQVFGHSASGERKRAPASQYEERYMGEDENEEEQIEEDDEEDDLEERGRRSVANHSWTPKHHYFSVRYVDEWMTRNGRRPAYDDYREFTSALWEEFKYTKVLKGQELIGPTRSRASKREFWFPNRNHNMVHSHFNKTWKDELEKMCERHFGVGDERMISKQQKKRPPEDEGEPRPVKKRPEGSGGGAGLGRLWNNPA